MKREYFYEERGGMLVMTLGILVIVNILLWAVLQMVVTESKITYNVRQNEQAVLATDAALELAEQAMLTAAEADEAKDLAAIPGEFALPGIEDTYFSFISGQTTEEAEGSFFYRVQCIGVSGKARHQVECLLFYDAVSKTVTRLSYQTG